MHKLEVYVIDFENYGIKDLIIELEQLDIGLIIVKDSTTTDIGEWSDDHELNKKITSLNKFREYFEEKQ